MKLRPTSPIYNAATWEEMCTHLNPLDRPGNTAFSSAWPNSHLAAGLNHCVNGNFCELVSIAGS